jgi:hypothetical protein
MIAASVNRNFITIIGGRDEVGAIFNLFLKLRADSNMMFLLVNVQQPGHKFDCNALHIEILLQNLLIHSIHVQQFNNVTDIMNLSSLVFQVSLSHFYHIFGLVPACPLSTDIRPFLKCLNGLWVWVRSRALSPNASLSTLYVSIVTTLLDFHFAAFSHT